MRFHRPCSLAVSWLLITVLSSTLACASGGTDGAEATSEVQTPTETQMPAGPFVGNVKETMDAAGYTYVLLERGGEQVWAAGPRTEVAVGDEISVGLEMPMNGFRSESLGRTFEVVYFVSALRSTASASGRDAPAADPHAGIPGFQGEKSSPDISLASIPKAEGGYRVAELWEQREELAQHEVVVRGRVVKYNAGILGRNWLHLQDGSGDPETGNNDITVTTNSTSAVGDLLTVRGLVSVDQDFGGGYRYELLIEKAVVEVE